jgi:arylsulfatase A-like enzyme
MFPRLPFRVIACILVSAVVAVVFNARCGVLPQRTTPTNLIIVCIDTVRYDSFWLPEAAGVEDTLSPWNRSAIRYQNAHSVSSWTVPTVASVLSGLYPVQHGAGSFKEDVADFQATTLPLGLPASVTTLAETLSSRGYDSVAMLSNPFIGPESGVMQGFSEVQDLDVETLPRAAIAWLQQRTSHKRPFFLYLQSMEAHDRHWSALPAITAAAATLPVQLPKAIARSGSPPVCRDLTSEWCLRYQAYVLSVLEARRNVAAILEGLKAADLLKSTIVIVYSDHGEEFLDGEQRDRVFRRDPRDIYGAGHGHNLSNVVLHVPLLVWDPRETGRDVTELVSVVDIAPTVRDALRLPPVAEDAGLSVLPQRIRSTPEAYAGRAVFASGIAYGATQFATIWEQWKRIEFSCPPKIVLHNVRADPQEQTILARDAAPRRLEVLATTYRTLPAHPAEEMAEMTADQIARLKSLGYLQGGTTPSGTGCPGESPSPFANPSSP